MTPSGTVPKTQPLQIAFSLLERVDLRSQKEGMGKVEWTGTKKGKSVFGSFFGYFLGLFCRPPKSHERKKHPKKICIKNFGGTLAGGSRRGLRRPNSLCRCWFSQQNTVHKEFRGGGSKGVLGVGSKVQFWGPISLCLCAFLGLEKDLF